MNKKVIFTENTVDGDGELTSKRWIEKKIVSKEHFIQAYIADIGALARCSGAEQSVILCSLQYLDWGTNKLYIDNKIRQEIAVCGNIKINTVNTSISRLVKKNILIKLSSSGYMLNPKLFFFGSEVDRDKIFELVIRYHIDENP